MATDKPDPAVTVNERVTRPDCFSAGPGHPRGKPPDNAYYNPYLTFPGSR